jgi:hypothetical protein
MQPKNVTSRRDAAVPPCKIFNLPVGAAVAAADNCVAVAEVVHVYVSAGDGDTAESMHGKFS